MSESKMDRILVLHALAECLGDSLTIQDIESRSGKITSNAEIELLEKRLIQQVCILRSEDKWPLTEFEMFESES